ncbi:MAG: hypothetical protein Q7K40_00480 [bacterium]|nr:hypothetical protein [bacterium]
MSAYLKLKSAQAVSWSFTVQTSHRELFTFILKELAFVLNSLPFVLSKKICLAFVFSPLCHAWAGTKKQRLFPQRNFF